MDPSGYGAYPSGKLTDYPLPDKELEKYTATTKDLPKAEMRKSGKW